MVEANIVSIAVVSACAHKRVHALHTYTSHHKTDKHEGLHFRDFKFINS